MATVELRKLFPEKKVEALLFCPLNGVIKVDRWLFHYFSDNQGNGDKFIC